MKKEGFITKILNLEEAVKEKDFLPSELTLWGSFENYKKLNYDRRGVKFMVIYYYGEIVAGISIFEKKYLGLLKIGSSPHTNLEVQYGHIFLKNQDSQRANEQLMEEFVGSLMDYIYKNNLIYFHLALPPPYSDVREFKWRGWKIIPNYTYILDLREIKKVGLSTYVGKKMRNIIKYAQEEQLVKTISGKEFYGCYQDTYRRQGKGVPHPEELFLKLSQLKNVVTLGAFDGKELTSAVMFCECMKTSYYITSGVTEKHHNSNGTTLLIYNYLEKLLKRDDIEKVDLFGANSKRIAHFKSFFDPKLQLYFIVTYIRIF